MAPGAGPARFSSSRPHSPRACRRRCCTATLVHHRHLPAAPIIARHNRITRPPPPRLARSRPNTGRAAGPFALDRGAPSVPPGPEPCVVLEANPSGPATGPLGTLAAGRASPSPFPVGDATVRRLAGDTARLGPSTFARPASGGTAALTFYQRLPSLGRRPGALWQSLFTSAFCRSAGVRGHCRTHFSPAPSVARPAAGGTAALTFHQRLLSLGRQRGALRQSLFTAPSVARPAAGGTAAVTFHQRLLLVGRAGSRGHCGSHFSPASYFLECFLVFFRTFVPINITQHSVMQLHCSTRMFQCCTTLQAAATSPLSLALSEFICPVSNVLGSVPLIPCFVAGNKHILFDMILAVVRGRVSS